MVTPDVVLLKTPCVLLSDTKDYRATAVRRNRDIAEAEAGVARGQSTGVVPTQLPVTLPPAALIFTSVSVKAAPVRLDALLFVSVRVIVEVPPD